MELPFFIWRTLDWYYRAVLVTFLFSLRVANRFSFIIHSKACKNHKWMNLQFFKITYLCIR